MRWVLTGMFRYSSGGSFLQLIPDMVFSFWAGLAIIILSRTGTYTELNETASEMGFGQMMALLLIAK